MSDTPLSAVPQARYPGWPAIERQIPRTPHSHLGAIVATRLMGFTDEAEQALTAAVQTFPTNVEILFEYAMLADSRLQWQEATQRWRAAQTAFPTHPGTASGLGRALQELGRLDEAEQVLDAAMRTFATDPASLADGWVRGIAVQHAQCATHRRDFPVALARWRRLHERFPDDDGLKALYGDTVMLMNLSAADQADSPPPPTVTPTHHMLAFEGLGDSCEFGLVQRHFGAEPLGLLRWVAIGVGALVDMLATRCEGVGDPDRTTLSVNEAREYITTDAQHGMTMHTFIRTSGQDEGKLYAQLCRRLYFLKRKLLDDLEVAEKIFVYRSSVGLSDAEVDALADALHAYNPRNTLLCVTLPDAAHPARTLQRRSDRLHVGYLPAGRPSGPGGAWQIDFDGWAAICAALHPG